MAAPTLLPPPPMDADGTTPPAPATPDPALPPPEPEPPLPRRRPPVRVTSEFDSEKRLFSHRLSCRVLDGLAKLRLRVSHGAGGGGIAWGPPEVALFARNFSVVVDPASRGAVLRGSADLAGSLRLRASHSTKEQQGEVSVTANLRDSPCKIELSSMVPPNGPPRATFFFPNGEVSIKEKILDESDRILSVNGLVKSRVLNGVCTAVYNDDAMNIKYRYKDDEISFIPSISLPSNSLSFAFKRQLTPSDKLSYWYNFDTNYWGAIYKHKENKHLKWKAGYESDNRLGWASLWVGDAGGSTKEVPLKAKVHLTLKFPQDNIQNSAVVFHVKKRWDF
ncbi:Outer envelope pore protein 37, chloroplastic [Dichanthelium oligosanthes]|uniref:Outer envelope pore protein 37, chloroplastic n=1 Tax=Dichanthelium oligosanthes TaxID=888268 RepID=A0A1E5WN19_9POAL|nr:Outer envelope pore protein 37, chloroplastic [Dichanthelium oligosanthes]